jgi:hypothetical protein
MEQLRPPACVSWPDSWQQSKVQWALTFNGLWIGLYLRALFFFVWGDTLDQSDHVIKSLKKWKRTHTPYTYMVQIMRAACARKQLCGSKCNRATPNRSAKVSRNRKSALVLTRGFRPLRLCVHETTRIHWQHSAVAVACHRRVPGPAYKITPDLRDPCISSSECQPGNLRYQDSYSLDRFTQKHTRLQAVTVCKNALNWSAGCVEDRAHQFTGDQLP